MYPPFFWYLNIYLYVMIPKNHPIFLCTISKTGIGNKRYKYMADGNMGLKRQIRHTGAYSWFIWLHDRHVIFAYRNFHVFLHVLLCILLCQYVNINKLLRLFLCMLTFSILSMCIFHKIWGLFICFFYLT